MTATGIESLHRDKHYCDGREDREADGVAPAGLGRKTKDAGRRFRSLGDAGQQMRCGQSRHRQRKTGRDDISVAAGQSDAEQRDMPHAGPGKKAERITLARA